jgi:hypothetical protein
MKGNSTKRPPLDPETYHPLESDQFVHPSLIVWRWKQGYYSDLRSAVEDYIFYSVISHARNKGKCFFSCIHIAETLGVMAKNPDGSVSDEPDADAIWLCVRYSKLIKRSGERGKRKRAWNIPGLLEWDEDKTAYGLNGAGNRSKRCWEPKASVLGTVSNGAGNRSHNSEVFKEDINEPLSEGNHLRFDSPSSTPHPTGDDLEDMNGGDGRDDVDGEDDQDGKDGNDESVSHSPFLSGSSGYPAATVPSVTPSPFNPSPLSHGVCRSPAPPVPQPPPSHLDPSNLAKREERKDERRQKELDADLEGQSHWGAMQAEASLIGGRMYAYKDLDGTVALEAADMAGLRGDLHRFRALYKRYLDWLKKDGKALSREKLSAKAFKEWVDLDMEEADSKAVAATPPRKVEGFPVWFLEMMPEAGADVIRDDAVRKCKTIASMLLIRSMLTDAVASYGAVLTGEMLRRFHGDAEAVRMITTSVRDFNDRQRKDYENYGSDGEPDTGLDGCLFADWRTRFGLSHKKADPVMQKDRDLSSRALEIIKGWPARAVDG